jgi:serine/arginine repetitive matrix protein 2
VSDECSWVGTLSALDAATNELASLISRLDLEATPSTPRGTLRLSPSFTTLLAESPRLKGSPKKSSFPGALAMRPSTASLTSLRPYPQSRAQEEVPDTQRYGQQIAPWPASPSKPLLTSATNSAPLAAPTAAGSSVPSPTSGQIVNSTTDYEPSFVFRALRRGKASQPVVPVSVLPMPLSQEHSFPTTATGSAHTETFAFESQTVSMKTSASLLAGSQKEFPLSRTFRKVMSTLSLRAKESEWSVGSEGTGMLMSNEARKDLGLAGTLGGSTSSRNPDLSLESDNPNSDIPNELRDILTGGNAERLDDLDDTVYFSPAPLVQLPPSPGLPPECPLPTPVMSQTCAVPSGASVNSSHLIAEEGQDDNDESDLSSLGENDTKKSFDFTGELKKLSESTGTHRHSFVEQLENAFRTPAKYHLDRFRPDEDIPPVPVIPSFESRRPVSDGASDPHVVTSTSAPPLLPSPEIVVSKKVKGTISYNILQDQVEKPPALSKPSYGQLDLNFRFGGSPLSSKPADASPLTLSDIIPSPAHARSLSLGSARGDDSTQQKAIPEAMSTALPDSSLRRQSNSDSSSTRSTDEDSRADAYSSHSRASSQTSFRGFESFDEIRRGFEFVDNRPAFYPPPFNNRRNQQPRDSMMSIASVSSYGFVINPGLKDPFDYGYESRPASADMSTVTTMSTTVDDTFSFIRRGPHRQRVDSDSSSFYFRAPGMSHIPRPLKGHVRQDSAMSTASVAPPVSIYNRNLGARRRIDSVSSIGSVLQAHPSHRFSGGNRSSWGPGHKRERSSDSVMSDMSVRMSRPTLGDKMLDSRHDYCLPLASIAASPPGSEATGRSYKPIRRRGSFDSILEKERHWRSRDSIIDQGNTGSSANSESVFGRVGSLAAYTSPDQLQMNDIRPFSLFSADGDSGSSDPKREDDTMISVSVLFQVVGLFIIGITQMIGGGRVRRRSVGSFVESSPLFFRAGKRKSTRRKQHNLVSSHEGLVESPNLARRVEDSPRGLGEGRMMSARQGLLSRNSLEEHCLSADGIDTSCE